MTLCLSLTLWHIAKKIGCTVQYSVLHIIGKIAGVNIVFSLLGKFKTLNCLDAPLKIPLSGTQSCCEVSTVCQTCAVPYPSMWFKYSGLLSLKFLFETEAANCMFSLGDIDG